MSATLLSVIILIALNVYPWYLVFSKSARRNAAKSAWWMSKATEEEIESGEAIVLGLALIAGMFFSITAFVAVVAALVKLTAP